MWTTKNRPRYDRDKLRYPSDLTDEEWSLDRATDTTGQTRRPQARGSAAGGGERRDVCAEHRLPVAIHPQGPAAKEYGYTTTSPAGTTTARSR